MNLLEKIDFMLEAVKAEIECNECGHKFKKKVTSKTTEVRCPKCGSYNTEIT